MTEDIRTWLSLALRMSLFAVALLWPAGTWRWWEAWIVILLWSGFGIFMTRYLIRRDPALLAERLKLLPLQAEQKTWDKVIMLLFLLAGVTLYLIPGFDVVRYQWSPPLPAWMRVFAMLLHLPCFVALAWVMRENTYLAQVVKVDQTRGHRVITTGPYALLRHPMYSVVIVQLFAFPVALGSRYALLVSLLLTALLVVRTWLEDRTLQRELAGYTEYTGKTRYRLFPGIW